jgi:antirestriction protein
MEEYGLGSEKMETCQAYLDAGLGDDLENFEEVYQGEWSCDEDFVQDLLEELGEIPRNFPSYIHIDWERTANDVMFDYTEQDGHYFRNL